MASGAVPAERPVAFSGDQEALARVRPESGEEGEARALDREALRNAVALRAEREDRCAPLVGRTARSGVEEAANLADPALVDDRAGKDEQQPGRLCRSRGRVQPFAATSATPSVSSVEPPSATIASTMSPSAAPETSEARVGTSRRSSLRVGMITLITERGTILIAMQYYRVAVHSSSLHPAVMKAPARRVGWLQRLKSGGESA
jgi:hypothetical protein